VSKEKTTQPDKKEEESTVSHKVLTIIGAVLCVILIPILLLNITLIIKSYTNKTDVPSVGGYLPLIVLTDSMYPDIKSGDLIICHTEDAENIKIGDVIAFFDPAGNGTSVVTHQVIDIVTEDGVLKFQTKGIANNVADPSLVPAENLVGLYRSKISGAGNVAMFFQTTTGLIVCVVLPMILLIAYDLIRRRMYEKSQKDDTDALLAELEALRAQKNARDENAEKDTEDSSKE
jgi:signal peptidase